MRYYVEVRRFGTEEVIKRMGPQGEHAAERLERSLSNNLNHEEYYTFLVPEDDSDEEGDEA